MNLSSTIPKVGAFIWDVGDAPRLKITFDVDGIPTDPATVTFAIQHPDKTQDTLVYGTSAIVRLSAGVYYIDWLFDAAGTWLFKWTGTGTVQAATPDVQVTIRETVFA